MILIIILTIFYGYLVYVFRKQNNDIKKLSLKIDKKITDVKLTTDKHLFRLQDDYVNLLPQISLLENSIFPSRHYRVHDILGVKYDEKTDLVYDYYLDNFVIGKIVNSNFKLLNDEIKNECKRYAYTYIDVDNDKTRPEIEGILYMRGIVSEEQRQKVNIESFMNEIRMYGINDYGELYHRPTGFILKTVKYLSDVYNTYIIGRRNKYDALVPFSVHDIVIYNKWKNRNGDLYMNCLYREDNVINYKKYVEYNEKN